MKRIATIIATTVLAALTTASTPAQNVEFVARFNPALNEFPEGIAVDRDGNAYLSLRTREIRKVTPAGVTSPYAHIPRGGVLGMKFDRNGNLYVAGGGSGIWKIDQNQNVSLFSVIPGAQFLNDLTFDKHGNIYITDSFTASIWMVDEEGNPTLFYQGGLLTPSPTTPPIFPGPLGPNGIAFDVTTGNVYVLVTQAGKIVEIGMNKDGTAGTARVYAQDNRMAGADGMAMDNRGNIYLCANVQHQIVRVAPGGVIDTVAQGGVLSTPTTLAFGCNGDQKALYISNNSLFFSPNQAAPGPGLARVEVGIPGRPLP